MCSSTTGRGVYARHGSHRDVVGAYPERDVFGREGPRPPHLVVLVGPAAAENEEFALLVLEVRMEGRHHWLRDAVHGEDGLGPIMKNHTSKVSV